MSNQDIVANIGRVWETIMALCVPSTEHEWQTPTDGPAWSVQDQVVHMLGSELRLLERAAPEPTPRDTSWSGGMRDLWHIRIFDAWIPQQDMRRAVKRPGDLAGPVAEHAVGRVAMAMPGSAGRTVALRTEGGRARILDESL